NGLSASARGISRPKYPPTRARVLAAACGGGGGAGNEDDPVVAGDGVAACLVDRARDREAGTDQVETGQLAVVTFAVLAECGLRLTGDRTGLGDREVLHV